MKVGKKYESYTKGIFLLKILFLRVSLQNNQDIDYSKYDFTLKGEWTPAEYICIPKWLKLVPKTYINYQYRTSISVKYICKIKSKKNIMYNITTNKVSKYSQLSN